MLRYIYLIYIYMFTSVNKLMYNCEDFVWLMESFVETFH